MQLQNLKHEFFCNRNQVFLTLTFDVQYTLDGGVVLGTLKTNF